MKLRTLITTAVLAAVAPVATAQTPAPRQQPAQQTSPQTSPGTNPQPSTSTRPAARAADVASPDAILAALYDTISGDAGAPRDWDRLRSLFIPEGRLAPIVARREGGFTTRVLTVDEFIAGSTSALKTTGFFERETDRKQERYGNLVHAFSAYESHRARTDAEPFARGTNSIQLMFDGARWWIIHVVWDSERPAAGVRH